MSFAVSCHFYSGGTFPVDRGRNLVAKAIEFAGRLAGLNLAIASLFKFAVKAKIEF